MPTGPLGQGISSAVGMALAEKMLATRFNTPEHTVIDHHTYVFLGDGCLMEGVSHEACSLAGVWGLGKLIALYDSNGISIDGKIDGWFTEDVAARYKAYGRPGRSPRRRRAPQPHHLQDPLRFRFLQGRLRLLPRLAPGRGRGRRHLCRSGMASARLLRAGRHRRRLGRP